MSKLERWWVVVVVAVAIVAGVVTAFVVNDEKNSIAAYAAIVGTVSILLAAEKHLRDKKKEDKEHQQKEDDKKEVLTATALYNTDRDGLIYEKTLDVEVFNAGKCVVPIKQVRFVHIAGSKETVVVMKCIEKKRTGDGESYEESKERVNLEPKQHARFVLMDTRRQYTKIQLASLIHANEMSIIVESFSGGVILAIDGSHIKLALVKGFEEERIRKEEYEKEQARKREQRAIGRANREKKRKDSTPQEEDDDDDFET